MLRPLFTLQHDGSESFVAYACELAGRFLGVTIRATSQGEMPVRPIAYGGTASSAFRIPRVSAYDGGSVPSLPSPRDYERAGDLQADFPFDLFTAMRYWLLDEGSQALPDAAFDTHDRLQSPSSVHHARNVVQDPPVNAYLQLLRHWLNVRYGNALTEPLRPRHKPCVMLSHDVDSPIDPTTFGHAAWLGFRALRSRRPRLTLAHLREAGRRARARLAVARGRLRRDPHWLFERIMRMEDSHGFRSTFFFASRDRFDTQAHPLDVAYDVRSLRFGRLFRLLRHEGWEVGLHASYHARESVATFRAELERLAQASGGAIVGNRHHYWHMHRDLSRTFQLHEAVGLTYDSSVAFEETPGYRLGIAFPFFPWDLREKRATRCLELPVMVMDGAFFYDPKADVDDVAERFSRLLAGLKRSEGIAAIDWHEYTSHPDAGQFGKWGRGYATVLEILASDPEIEVMSAGAAAARFTGVAAPARADRDPQQLHNE